MLHSGSTICKQFINSVTYIILDINLVCNSYIEMYYCGRTIFCGVPIFMVFCGFDKPQTQIPNKMLNLHCSIMKSNTSKLHELEKF